MTECRQWDCSREAKTLGWCIMHYWRDRRGQKMEGPGRGRSNVTTEEDKRDWLMRPPTRHAERGWKTEGECGGKLFPLIVKGGLLFVECDRCGLRFPPVPASLLDN